MTGALPRLMVVGADVRGVLVPAAGAGALVQLRRPQAPPETIAGLAAEALAAGVDRHRLLVNSVHSGGPTGSQAIALRLGCGLHLPAAARLDPGLARPAPWGRSVHSLEAAIDAMAETPDYLVLGTIYPTPGKPGRAGAGPALVRAVAGRVAPLPVFAIGGIDRERLSEVRSAGAHGVAVARAVACAPEPAGAAADLLALLERPVNG